MAPVQLFIFLGLIVGSASALYPSLWASLLPSGGFTFPQTLDQFKAERCTTLASYPSRSEMPLTPDLTFELLTAFISVSEYCAYCYDNATTYLEELPMCQLYQSTINNFTYSGCLQQMDIDELCKPENTWLSPTPAWLRPQFAAHVVTAWSSIPPLQEGPAADKFIPNTDLVTFCNSALFGSTSDWMLERGDAWRAIFPYVSIALMDIMKSTHYSDGTPYQDPTWFWSNYGQFGYYEGAARGLFEPEQLMDLCSPPYVLLSPGNYVGQPPSGLRPEFVSSGGQQLPLVAVNGWWGPFSVQGLPLVWPDATYQSATELTVPIRPGLPLYPDNTYYGVNNSRPDNDWTRLILNYNGFFLDELLWESRRFAFDIQEFWLDFSTANWTGSWPAPSTRDGVLSYNPSVFAVEGVDRSTVTVY